MANLSFIMDFIEHGIRWLQQLPPGGVLALMFFLAFIENIFPPSPSDVLLVFAGTLIGIGTIDFAPALIVSTLGSTCGFVLAYLVGRYFQEHILTGRLSRYLPLSAINQVERLFQRFGYGVIVVNRFLAGTRAIVSFVSGMSEMNLPMTTLLCAISAAAWNAILLYLGMVFGKNWQKVGQYLSIYSTVVTIIVLALLAFYVWRYLRNRRNPTPEI
ncbi:MAG: DedA family protein [Acidobacteria bacterium]|nr:DedA family protein [Acidobacteriota bacterium]